MLLVTGENENLVRHLLLGGSLEGVTDANISRICSTLDMKVSAIGEKTVSVRSRLLALADKFLTDKSLEEKTAIVAKLLKGRQAKTEASVGPKDLMLDALQELEANEQGDFDKVKQILEADAAAAEAAAKAGEPDKKKRRTADEKRQMENTTPDCIRNLKPRDAPKGCLIVMDFGLRSFEGYYPGGNPTASTSASWKTHGMAPALAMIVKYVISNHRRKGFDSELQTETLC